MTPSLIPASPFARVGIEQRRIDLQCAFLASTLPRSTPSGSSPASLVARGAAPTQSWLDERVCGSFSSLRDLAFLRHGVSYVGRVGQPA